VGLERTLRRWLDSHGLLAITATVLGIIVVLALLLVVGGYLYGLDQAFAHLATKLIDLQK